MEEYEDLFDVMSFDGFSYINWAIDEDRIIRPRLEEAGYYAITFANGEADSFGPLTRVVSCIDPSGKLRKFIYG